MKVLILGGSGMLGHKLAQTWKEDFDVWITLRGNGKKYEHLSLFDSSKTLENVAVENLDSVTKAFDAVRPDVVVNCIGVIKQHEAAKNPVMSLSVNSIFPHRLADLCRAFGARLISLSTDCVFSGRSGNYNETDLPDAEDLYGQSKRWGEVTGENCLTLRTSIIGREIETSHSLVEWFLSNEGGCVKGFTNAIYSGFPTIVLAEILGDIIKNHQDLRGVWHVSSEPINKYELLLLVRAAYNVNIEIEPFDDFQIDRSLNSSRFRAEANFQPAGWREMIEKMAADKTPYDEWRKNG